MKITAIKQQVRSENRVSIYVDEVYSFSLTLDQLLETKLKKGSELELGDIARFRALSDQGKIRARTLEWVLVRPRSEQEMRNYLYRKKVEKDLIEALAIEFRKKRYVDDELYAKWLFELRWRKHKSMRAIISELKMNGITDVTIQNIVSENPDLNEEQSILTIVNKLRKRTRYQDNAKLIPYLLSKGFSYDMVKRALALESEAN